jgi:hypothetical protein
MKEGYVYIFHISSENRIWDHKGELYKIGHTTNLKTRLSSIRSFVGENAELIASSKVLDRYTAEYRMHQKFWKFVCTKPFGIDLLNVYEFFLFEDKILNKAIVELWKQPYYEIKYTNSI